MKEINICLLPSKEIWQKSIQMSQQISSQHDSIFTLSNHNFIPHISLYHLGIPDENLSLVQNKLNQLPKPSQKLLIRLITFSDVKDYISWDAEITKNLISLQKLVLQHINPLREGVQRKSLDEYRQYYSDQPKKFENIEKFGYPLVGKFFNPHITISRLKDHNITPQPTLNLNPIEMSFEINELHIGNIRENGTCSEIISSHALK